MAKKKPIVSPLGQWAYPGEVTIIPSSNITMKGVNYPVLGVDDLGNSQMMMPGQDYNFPGQYVTEYPQMQFGGMSKRKIDKILNQNKDLNFVQRMYQSNTPSIMIPGQQRPSTHFMESTDGRVYPTVVQMPDGSLQYLGDNAYDYANQTGQYIEFPNDRQARRFAKSYKKGTGVLQEFGKGGLRQWFAEEWTDVKTGKPCGRSGKEKGSRPYPACRPKNRVNETTPKTTSEMSSAEKAKFKREKTSGKRIDYNHKRREDGGETWLDQYQDAGEVPSNIERMQGVDIKRKKNKVNDSPRYQYDDKGNLLYTPELNIWPYASDGSSRDEFLVNPKLSVQNLNPTLEEFINVASPYYPIDNKLVTDPKINLQSSNYQRSLEQEYVLPQIVGKSFGNLPIVKDDGYSPNRRWVSNLRAKDTGARFGKDSYAYVLKTNPNNLVDYSTKNAIEAAVSSNDKNFYDYLEKNNYSLNTVQELEKNRPDQIWNRAEQMRVEMRNNPEIMSWANLHNVDLGYKEKGKGDDRFASKIPESIYASRLVKAGLPTNRPDYEYKPMETYIVQDPSKFDLAGYFPMGSIAKDAEQKVLNKKIPGKLKREYISSNSPEYFEKEAYIKDEMARRMGINPSAFDSGEYLIHYNQSPITEYTPGKKYGGWLEEYQRGGTLPPIYTSNVNDPRIRNYNDSLDLYNKNTLAAYNLLKKYPAFKLPKVENVYKKDPNDSGDLMHAPYLVATEKYIDYGNYIRKNNATGVSKDNGNVNDVRNYDFNGRILQDENKIKPIGYQKVVENTETFDDYSNFFPVYKKPVQPIIYKPSLFVSNIDRDMYTPGGGMAREYNIGVTLQDGNRKSFRTEKEFQDWKAANNLDISKAKVTEGRGYSYDYPENKKYGGWLNKYQNAGEVPFDVERMQGVDIRKKRSWLDKLKGVVHRGERAIGLDPYNERSDDFFEQLARRINTATGGKDWYKQPNDASGAGGLPTAMMETVMAPFSIPQLAATYGVTGKVQTPSQAMDIQNPVGAFLTDAVLDPTNLVGAGIAKNLGKGSLQNMLRNRSRGVKPDFTPNVSNQLDTIPSDVMESWARDLNNASDNRDITDLFENYTKGINKSGLKREDVLKNKFIKNKDLIRTLHDSDFENTVLKPTGEISFYEPSLNLDLKYDINSRRLNLPDAIQTDSKEYIDAFNSRLNWLNEIIANNNKSGFDYSIKGLEPGGLRYFNPTQKETIINPNIFEDLKKRGYVDNNGNVDPRFQEYFERWGKMTRTIPEGETMWGVTINPGQWRGEVQDIANESYFKTIPGLDMRVSTEGVFSDRIPRRGTRTYESINEYLKLMDLGRVKSGFNTQSESSFGLWEDAIKKGKAFGYYANPHAIYGSMKTVAPLAAGAAAASQLPEQKNGGWLDTYQDGGENLPELNSKIDIANFYKNPLSEKYAIYQDPTDKGYKYYLKSAEEPNIPSKTFDFTNLGNIARRIDKKEITTPQPIKYNSKMIDYAADQDYLTALATEEFPIIPPSFKDVLSNIPKLETINTIPKPKALPNKQPAVNNAFTFDSNYWNSADIQTEVFNRQLKDNKWYGEFDKRGDNVLNRTDVKRNYDSEVFLQNLATPNSVVIDIGSALGNNNPKLAGVSVYELASNPKIKSKNIKVIATDIPSEVKGFEELKRRGNSVYPIDYAQVPETFNTPVRDILKAKNLENVKDVYLRAANSIDLLMNVQETSEHFKHISSTLKDKNVTYLYNNTILYKPAGSTKFKKLGNLNNSAFDHRSPSWKNNPNRNHYTLLPTNKTGGEISWLNKYK